MAILRDIMSAVAVDEVGIHTARVGPLLLKTAYQPVYARDGDWLCIAAMASSTVAILAGHPVRHAFLAAMSMKERGRSLGIGCALGVLNRTNMDAQALPVIISAGEGADAHMADWPDMLAELCAQTWPVDVRPGRVICEMPPVELMPLEDQARFAAECRRCGFELSLGGFSGLAAAVETVRAMLPEIVSLDARWFAQIAASPMAARLLPALLRSLKTAGGRVHVNGIDNAELLTAAIRAGADLLQGSLLAQPALAGTLIYQNAIPVVDSVNSAGNVVPLFG